MSNWPINCGARTETIGLGTGQGTTITANATADVKGSYASLGTAGFDYSGFLLSVVNLQASMQRHRIDIAINNGGSDIVIVPDLFVEITNLSSTDLFIPIRIPSGATVKMRCQSGNGSSQLSCSIAGYARDFPGEPPHSQAVSCTDFTNTLPTNTVVETNTTFTAWTTICSATPARLAGILITLSSAGDTSRTATNYIVEIGFGAGGSEVSLIKLSSRQTTSIFPTGCAWYLPCDLPAGVRLAFRVQTNSGSAADTTAVAILGIAA